MTLSERAKQIKDKAMKTLSELFSKEEIVILQAELAASVVAPVVPLAAAPKEFKTKDGVSIFITDADAEGNPVATTSKAFSDANGLVAMANGDYVLENGNTLTIADGIVSVVKEVEVAPDPDPMAEMKTQLSAHTKELDKTYAVKLAAIETKFTTELDKVKTTNKVLLATIDKILNAPIKSTPSTGVEKKREDMTNNEKVRNDRGEKIYQ